MAIFHFPLVSSTLVPSWPLLHVDFLRRFKVFYLQEKNLSPVSGLHQDPSVVRARLLWRADYCLQENHLLSLAARRNELIREE